MIFLPTPKQISQVIGSPLANVEKYWPLIDKAMLRYGMACDAGIIVALSTIAVECATFAPIEEHGGNAYFIEHYWTDTKVRRNLGNLTAEQAVLYRGRGFIQLTGRLNYMKYGKLLNLPLLTNPELALLPNNAALLFALFLQDHGVVTWALKAIHDCDPKEQERSWQMCRRLVNGGLTNYARFRQVQKRLAALAGQ